MAPLFLKYDFIMGYFLCIGLLYEQVLIGQYDKISYFLFIVAHVTKIQYKLITVRLISLLLLHAVRDVGHVKNAHLLAHTTTVFIYTNSFDIVQI